MGDVLPKSAAVLDTAKETICGPRQADYGHPRQNLADVAALWSAILPVERALTPRDVCKAMIAMKLSRDKNRPKHDNVVDIIGYAALIPEVEPEEKENPALDPDIEARIDEARRDEYAMIYRAVKFQRVGDNNDWFCTAADCDQDATFEPVDASESSDGFCDYHAPPGVGFVIPTKHFEEQPPTVYVAGPYSRGLFDENIANVTDAADRLAAHGVLPFIPHTLTFLWAVRHQHPAEFWYEFDMHWLAKCDAILRLPGDSPGSDREVELAKEYNLPVFHSVEEVLAVIQGAA